MLCLNTPPTNINIGMCENIALDFIETQEKLNSIGYELIGTKDINEQTIYLIKEK